MGLFDPKPGNLLYVPSLMYNKIFGGKGPTPSSMIKAPSAPQISIGGGNAARIGGVIGKSYPGSANDQALAKLQQLREALLSQSQGMSSGDMLSQASMSAGLQYDPQIAQIQALMNNAKKTTKEQQGVVKSTYEDLANSYKGDVKHAKKIAADAHHQETAQLQDLKNGLKNDYADSMSMLRDKMSQLGIESAAPDVLPDLAGDLTNYTSRADKESADYQRAISQREAGDTSYFTKGAPIARMAGAEGSAKLSEALQQYLFQQQGQMGQLQAQRQLAIQSAMGQMQQDQAGIQSDVWSRLKDISKQEQSLLKPKTFGSGLSGASNYLTEQFTNNPYDRQFGVGEASRYLGILQSLIGNMGGEQFRLSPEQMVNRAAQYAKKAGISERILTRAMLTYLGKG